MRAFLRPKYPIAGGFAALALSVLLAPAAGFAHGGSVGAVAPAGTTSPASCLIHSMPSFMAQGEFASSATVADVLEVECNPSLYGTGGAVTITAAQLFSRCHEVTWYVPNEPVGGGFVSSSGPSVHLRVDVDGNATVALIAGPRCHVGESLIALDEDESPYDTFTTSFQVLPTAPTPEGVYAMPAAQVEDAASSAVATVVQAEFKGASEAKVRLGSDQLYARCQNAPHLIWVRENREVVIGPELVGEHAVELDNDGNGFALAIGSDSCAPGRSLIEADLERNPFTTLVTEFEVLPPQPTEEPSFSIVKEQEIKGSGAGFTTLPLTSLKGETVDYRITVTNTAHVTETFSGFTDPHCDPGTIAGAPGSTPVGPGESTVYTCDHVLEATGKYTNEATVTGSTVGGRPVTQTSNQVVVTVGERKLTPSEPAFTIEKRQRIGASTSFTTATLIGAVGSTVEYEVSVTNTGNVGLKLSSFSDPTCDPGTIAGGPGEAEVAPHGSTTYMCTRRLTTTGRFANVATVTAAPPHEAPMTLTSNRVEVVVPGGGTPGVGPNQERGTQKVAAFCETSRPVLHGGSGIQTGNLTVWVRSNGIARITFYLDGRRLRSFKQSQARSGKFKLTIDARKLSYGVHHISFRVAMINSGCAAAASARMFFRPRPSLGSRFTG